MAGPETLDLQHRELVEGYLRRHPPVVSEHTFTNLFAWRDARPILLREVEAALLFLAESGEELVLWGPPAGRVALADLPALLEGRTDRPVRSAERIPEADLAGLEGEGFEVEADRDNSDYVYRRADLAELAGRRYHAKRNMVERCLSAHECAYEEITEAALGEVAEMQDRWCAERDCGRVPALCAEYRAIREVLDHWRDLSVLGAAVRVDGKIDAYTIGEALNESTAVIHFEKAMARVEGLYQVVNQWFCRNHLERFDYVNREQDLGVPGLRKAKQSYRPDHMVEKCTVRRIGAGRSAEARLADAESHCPCCG